MGKSNLPDPSASRSVMSIKDLSELTMIKTEDIISTLQFLNLLAYQKAGPDRYACHVILHIVDPRA